MEKKDKGIKWEIEKRLEFIEFRLFWEGRINRHDVRTVFNVSNPQVSTDFAKYQEIAPGNMLYDKRKKLYYASPAFKPAFVKPSSDQYLLSYMSILNKTIPQEKSFIGFMPPVGNVPTPGRKIDPNILRRVIIAINNKQALEIEYNSMSESGRAKRWISPHALGSDNFRWHCRAFCHLDNKFKDFVLGRILEISNEKNSDAKPEEDNDWNTFIHVKIGPSPELSERKRKIIEHEYGMINGEINIDVRRSMLLYFINFLGLQEEIAEGFKKQYITLLNSDEVKRALSI